MIYNEINKRVTLHTLTYRSPDAIPGEYTTTDMAAGDTVFGDHEELIARVPQLLESTERAIQAAIHCSSFHQAAEMNTSPLFV